MSRINRGFGSTKYGPGIEIHMTKDEVATAIIHWLHGQGVYVYGPRTVRVGGELCGPAEVYVCPSGFVMSPDGRRHNGDGTIDE